MKKIHIHQYEDATCYKPQTCSCGKTKGNPLEHDYSEKTCSTPQICKRCGATGSRADHDYADATCSTPLTCKACGATTGDSLGHLYNGVPTCTEPQHCTRCGQPGTSVLGHDFSTPTCTASGICSRCGLAGEAPLGHSYSMPLAHHRKPANAVGRQLVRLLDIAILKPIVPSLKNAKIVELQTVIRLDTTTRTVVAPVVEKQIRIRFR